MIDCVLLSTDPAKLILTLGTDHMVASALLFLHNQTTLRTVRDLSFVVQPLEVFLHGLVKLSLAVFTLVVREPALDANFILAPLTLSVVRVQSVEDTRSLLLEVMGK